LSGRGLCDELITRPEESYRLCCVVVCDLETSRMGAPYIYDISHLRVKPKYLPQHPTLKHPPTTFLHQRERPCFTSTQNNRRNYTSVDLNLYIFGYQTEDKNTAPKDSKRYLLLITSLMEFCFLKVAPKHLNCSTFQRKYYQLFLCDFDLHSCLKI